MREVAEAISSAWGGTTWSQAVFPMVRKLKLTADLGLTHTLTVRQQEAIHSTLTHLADQLDKSEARIREMADREVARDLAAPVPAGPAVRPWWRRAIEWLGKAIENAYIDDRA